jgi:hypothetical protein
MKSIVAPYKSAPKMLDALDFEPVDVEEAKKALDRDGLIGNLAPTREQMHPSKPQAMRQAPAQQDLPTGTVRWALTLPAENRPLFLLTHYPKIANKLAEIWSDRGCVQSYFDELMLDHRGDRAGFPQEAFNDLMRLQQLLLPAAMTLTELDAEADPALPEDSPLARLMARLGASPAGGKPNA